MPKIYKMKQGDDMIRCAIYDRVSTERQVSEGLSLETQKADLTKYANDHGYYIVDYYADEGITARKKQSNRKDLMRLLDDVRANKIDIILVTKLDRWFRNVRDYHNTQAILEEHHCCWKTIYEDYDSSTADGQLKINIMLSVAQNECDRTSERIKAVFHHKWANGEVLSSMWAPYGYKVVNGKLYKDENEREIVEDAYAHYFSCYSIRKTYFYITEKYSDSPYCPTYNMINRLFKNEKYTGTVNGVENFCEPYITSDQLHRIREISQAKTSVRSHIYLFSSMIECPVCGCKLSGYQKKTKKPNGKIYINSGYRCVNKYNRHRGPCISENVIERYMLSHIADALEEEMLQLNTRSKKKTDPSIKLKEEMKRLNILFQKGRISEDYYEEQYLAAEKKLSAYKNVPSYEDYNFLKETFSGDWIDVYQALDLAHKQAFWKSCVKCIHIDAKTRKISGFSFLV